MTNQLRHDGIYVSTVFRVMIGFMYLGPPPEQRFFHQTTNPPHFYTRPYTVESSLIKWRLGGLGDEEQHAILGPSGTLVAAEPHVFVPFAPPQYGLPYRVLTNKETNELAPEIVDSLGDDNYKRIK
jgi:hypothetical protein